VSGLLAATLLLWAAFREVRFAEVRALLGGRVEILLLVVVPFAVANWIDAKGWQRLLRQLGSTVRFRDVYATQLAGEAAILSLPMGFAVSEPMRAMLLGRRANVAIDMGVASTLARKAFLILAEGLVVGLAFVLGLETFQKVSHVVIGSAGLEWLALGASIFLCTAGLGMAVTLGRGAVATRALEFLRRFTPRRLAGVFERKGHKFTATDRALERFFSTDPRRLGPALAWYVAVWLFEALEVFVVLRVLGAPVTFVEALSMEAALAFLRSLVVFLPAGLGLQDLGYVLFLRALGVPDALIVGAAFSVVKRCKEGLWVAIGYSCLLASRRPATPVVSEALA
jgi:uncharacterized protein (TIRG00374 family)